MSNKELVPNSNGTSNEPKGLGSLLRLFFRRRRLSDGAAELYAETRHTYSPDGKYFGRQPVPGGTAQGGQRQLNYGEEVFRGHFD